MFCKNCGINLPDDAKFCPSCGVTTAPPEPARQAPPEPEPISYVYTPPEASRQEPPCDPPRDPYRNPYGNPYQQPYTPPPAPRAGTPNPVTVMVLGIISAALATLASLYFLSYMDSDTTGDGIDEIFVFFLFPVAALVLGCIAKTLANRIKHALGYLPPKARIGRSFGTVGFISGIVLSAFWAVVAVIVVIVALFGITLGLFGL